MLIRYYITSVIIAVLMIVIGQPLRSIIPIVCMIVISTGTIQSKHHSINSMQQFATDNVMLLSWIVLTLGVVRMMNIGGYSILTSSIYISVITIILYCICLGSNYSDGIIVGHQASVLSTILVYCIIVIYSIQNVGSIQQYLGIGAVYTIIISLITSLYRLLSHAFTWTLPHNLRDEIILGCCFITPILIIGTILSNTIALRCLTIIILYMIYGILLCQLDKHQSPIEDKKDLTIDLILKGYKTSYISHLTRWSRVNQAISIIKDIGNPIRTIIQQLPNIVMSGAYIYLATNIITQGGIKISDFIVYCITFIVYISLSYIYQQSGNIIKVDNISRSFIIGYLSMMLLMIIIFAGDPISGSVIGVLWIIINALMVTQYRTMKLDRYISYHHTKRRVRANTTAACMMIGILVQLPIDGVMIIPVILIIGALLGLTIAQSYSTLRTLK